MKNVLIAIKWITAIAGILVIMLSATKESQLLFCIGVILEECAVIAYLYIDLKYDVSQQVPSPNKITEEDRAMWYRAHEPEIEIDCSPSDIMTNSEITAACIKTGITDAEEIKWVQNSLAAKTKANVEEYIQYILAQR